MSGALFIAVFTDLLFGEAQTPRHPIALLGKAMESSAAFLRSIARGPTSKKIAGIIITVSFSGGAFLLAWKLITAAGLLSVWLGYGIEVAIMWLSISTGELVKINRKINKLLAADKIDEARLLLARIVGRETKTMSATEIRTAALESLSENLVDAGIAPVFYALIGGGAGAFTYRVINTLDSMFGYRSAEFIDFGWASARLDDVASWLPARLSVIIFAPAAALTGRSFAGALRSAFSDGRKHASPNSGLPISAMAGALAIRLGGPRVYTGKSEFYGFFGPGERPVNETTVDEAVTLTVVALVLTVFLGAALRYGLGAFS